MSPPLSLLAYKLVTGLIEPAAPLVLGARALRGKEERARLNERLGKGGGERPPGPLVWLHGVSVGEGVSLMPLIERLRSERPDLAILVTSGTRTAAALMAKRLPQGALHRFAPIDTPRAVGRFLDHWRPNLGLFVVSELWPNLILAARARDVRLALVSARMTAASARGWSRGKAAARTVLEAFDVILPQDDATAARLAMLGGHVTGRLNLKRMGAPLAADMRELRRLKAAIGKRRVILAASTHAGEETMVAIAVRGLSERPLLIVVPRHPERGGAVAAELRALGLRLARRSEQGVGGREDFADIDAYVADTLGEIGLFYRLASIAVMGGGFAAGVGGHNPMEAARLGVGVISGPHVANHADVYLQMAERGAAAIAADGEALAAILAAPAATKGLGPKARAFAQAQAGAFEAGWEMLQPLLPPA